MKPLAERDYFTDYEILKDPYSYFEAIRAKGPIYRNPENGIIVVTGFDELLEVIKNTEDFSSAIAPQGPAVPLPFEAKGPDITADIEAHRAQFVGGELLVALDDKPHSLSRALLNRLFVPSRLKANEEFMTSFADDMVREAVMQGSCELMKEIATPFVTIVIADLLGVPANDRQLFMDVIEAGTGAGSLDPDNLSQQNQPLVVMGMYFAQYVSDRRKYPRDDVLSELANASYPDGSTPDAMEIVRLATFLFAAGQDTSAKLLGNAMTFIVDQPGLQQRLRADPSLIPAFLEEVLRLEGSTKMTARVARRDTQIGDMKIAAGTTVMLALAAANRDPRRWENPTDLELGRPRIKEHLAFGRGAHVCAGAPLARAEVKIILEKLLEHTSHIDLDEEAHGTAGSRKLDYEPTFIIRGLSELHVKLAPSEALAAAPPPKRNGKAGIKTRKAEEKPVPTGYSTEDTTIGSLLADPRTKAVVDRHFPGMSANPQILMANGMSLRALQKFAPDFFSAEALDAADAELAQLEFKG